MKNREIKFRKGKQFIGIIDRNGIEIYEGDTVKFRSHPNKEIIGEVYYCNERARFEIKSSDEFEKSKNTYSINNFSHITYVEVINNKNELLDDADVHTGADDPYERGFSRIDEMDF